MQAMISFCGLECSHCPAFIARMNNDDELRRKTAAAWSELFKTEFSPERIDCDGCCANGVRGPYCSTCEIRACAVSRGVSTCAHCPDYGCDRLEKVHAMDAQCRDRLDEIRKRL